MRPRGCAIALSRRQIFDRRGHIHTRIAVEISMHIEREQNQQAGKTHHPENQLREMLEKHRIVFGHK